MAVTEGKTLIDTIQSWPGVSLEPHRFGGTAFVLNGKEIGHLHGDSLVDLTLSKEARDEAIRRGKAMPHHIMPDSNWVSIYLRTEEDTANAIELLRFKYEQMIASNSP